MTTIIVDGKTQAVYSDSCTTYSVPGGRLSGDSGPKIHRINGKVLAGAGRVSEIDNFLSFFGQSDLPIKSLSSKGDLSARVLVCEKRGVGVLVRVYEIQPPTKGYFRITRFWKQINTHHLSSTDFLMIGGGAEYAEGAMRQGATPREAIKISALCTDGTDDKVQQMNLLEEDNDINIQDNT